MGGEGVQGVEAFRQDAFQVIHGVHEAGIGFDQAPPDEPHGARLADPRHVVAVHVGAHGEFRLLFFRGDELLDVFGRFHGGISHGNGAGDGAGFHAPPLHPDVHFRRGTHQLLPPQIDQKAVGAGVPAADAPEQLRGRPAVGHGKGLGEHHLEVIALPAALPDPFDLGLEFPRGVVAADFGGPSFGWEGLPGPSLAVLASLAAGAGGPRRGLEIVDEARGPLQAPVHHHQFGGEEQAAIQLLRRAPVARAQSLELKHQVESEGAVETQLPFLAAQKFQQCPQHGKQAGLLAPLLLREELGRRRQLARDEVRPFLDFHEVGMVAENRCQEREQAPTLAVEGAQ